VYILYQTRQVVNFFNNHPEKIFDLFLFTPHLLSAILFEPLSYLNCCAPTAQLAGVSDSDISAPSS
jgi:hypothetical protein